jgi:hypothetical protein
VSADDGALAHARRHPGALCMLDLYSYIFLLSPVEAHLRNNIIVASFRSNPHAP